MSYDQLTDLQLIKLFCLLTDTPEWPAFEYTIIWDTHGHPAGRLIQVQNKLFGYTLRFDCFTLDIFNWKSWENSEKVYLHQHPGAFELCQSFGITFPVVP